LYKCGTLFIDCLRTHFGSRMNPHGFGVAEGAPPLIAIVDGTIGKWSFGLVGYTQTQIERDIGSTPSRSITGEQSSGKLASATQVTKAKDAAVQIARIRPEIRFRLRRRLQYLQPSTTPDLPKNAPHLPRGGERCLDGCNRCRLISKPYQSSPPASVKLSMPRKWTDTVAPARSRPAQREPS
jgi:hypothetical protein